MGKKIITGQSGYDISGESEELKDGFREYSQYLLGLSCLVEPVGNEPKAECYFFSGFVMQFGRSWFWVTAGHIIKNIEEHLAQGVVSRFRLIDHYGFGGDHSNAVPFDYEGAWRYYVFDEVEGLDFGAVEIGSFYRQTLEANEVAVVRKADWRMLNPCRFPSFVVTGLAEDSIERSKTYKSDHYVVRGKAVPSLVLCSQVEVPEDWERPYQRIAGNISPNWPAGSIVGMSGGPVFGLRNRPYRTRVIGVQSSWRKAERVSLVCPITVFGPMLEEQVRGRRTQPNRRGQ